MAAAGERRNRRVHLVTSAHASHSEEMSSRSKRYLASMGVRTLCLVLAIFVLHGLWRLLGIAAAVVLPYVAVVLANAGPAERGGEPEFVVQSELRPAAESRSVDDDRPPADDGA